MNTPADTTIATLNTRNANVTGRRLWRRDKAFEWNPQHRLVLMSGQPVQRDAAESQPRFQVAG
ncbi:hypothetical protein [Specibacter sp. RAF43]|uniref:hypothetical protein n=1 Tax=Specibacter sp. RAF43 TaxID=3233057 RepID=UPI003F9E6B33